MSQGVSNHGVRSQGVSEPGGRVSQGSSQGVMSQGRREFISQEVCESGSEESWIEEPGSELVGACGAGEGISQGQSQGGIESGCEWVRE